MTTKQLYPIHCKLVTQSEPIQEVPVDVIQVSHSGMLVDSLSSHLPVNKSYELRIQFPFTDTATSVDVVVFRTYAELNTNAPGPKKTRLLNELVYKKPQRSFNEMLIKFLANISHRTKA